MHEQAERVPVGGGAQPSPDDSPATADPLTAASLTYGSAPRPLLEAHADAYAGPAAGDEPDDVGRARLSRADDAPRAVQGEPAIPLASDHSHGAAIHAPANPLELCAVRSPAPERALERVPHDDSGRRLGVGHMGRRDE